MGRQANGEGRVFQPKWKRDGETHTARTWAIAYTDPRRPVGKQQVRESTGSTSETKAHKLLRQRLSEIEQGKPTGPDVDKTTLGDLATMLTDDYKVNERRSLTRIEQSLVHIVGNDKEGEDHHDGFFGKNHKTRHVTADRVSAYVLHRRSEGAKAATINRELACLRRMFRLGNRAGRVAFKPEITLLKENNRGKGFFEREEHELLLAHLPADAADVAEFLYWTGWRRGEVLGLEWSNVDERAQVIRIEDSKADEPRTLPYGKVPALVALMQRRRAITDAAQKEGGKIVKQVFHRNGAPLRYFRRAWISACIAAGLGREVRDAKGKLVKKVALRKVHDYRRSAARNLSRAGVPEQVIMVLCGWKTRSVFDRYRIVAERDLAEGLAKLVAAEPTPTPAESTGGKVVAFAK
jgi:integrase